MCSYCNMYLQYPQNNFKCEHFDYLDVKLFLIVVIIKYTTFIDINNNFDLTIDRFCMFLTLKGYMGVKTPRYCSFLVVTRFKLCQPFALQSILFICKQLLNTYGKWSFAPEFFATRLLIDTHNSYNALLINDVSVYLCMCFIELHMENGDYFQDYSNASTKIFYQSYTSICRRVD